MTKRPPIVTIAGRQNVGKSTLFNALIKTRKAIVDSSPGLTRDIISFAVNYQKTTFLLSDTPGLDIKDSSELSQAILNNAERQLKKSSVIILLMENPVPLPFDYDLTNIIRKLSIPAIVAVNKMDQQSDMANIANFYELGINEIIPISALRRNNLNLLLDKAINFLPDNLQAQEDIALRIAIVGRPNSGKSSLLNSFIGDIRSVVSDIPGTTRDAVDEDFFFYGQRVRVIDTAGIRKKSRIRDKISYYSLTRTIDSIKKCDVVVHLLDATIGITDTDKKISDEIVKAKKPAIMAINKWDIINKDSKTFNEFRDKIIFKFFKAADFPIMSISAKDKTRIHRLIKTAMELNKSAAMRIETPRFNKIIEKMLTVNRPPELGDKLKILYGTQIDTSPPQFTLFVNNPLLFKKDVTRFIEKYLQRVLQLNGVPVLLKIEGRKRK